MSTQKNINNVNNIKNGGFPPIKYCSSSTNNSNSITKDGDSNKTKERFFSNAPRQNINIRQLLSDTTKKPIILTETLKNDVLEIVDSI